MGIVKVMPFHYCIAAHKIRIMTHDPKSRQFRKLAEKPELAQIE